MPLTATTLSPRVVYTQDTEPTDKTEGKLWYNTTNNSLYTSDGTSYILLDPVTKQATEPTDKTEGKLWFNTTEDALYTADGINYNKIDTNTNTQGRVLLADSTSSGTISLGDTSDYATLEFEIRGNASADGALAMVVNNTFNTYNGAYQSSTTTTTTSGGTGAFPLGRVTNTGETFVTGRITNDSTYTKLMNCECVTRLSSGTNGEKYTGWGVFAKTEIINSVDISAGSFTSVRVRVWGIL